jgi:hypothetical protein
MYKIINSAWNQITNLYFFQRGVLNMNLIVSTAAFRFETENFNKLLLQANNMQVIIK